MVLQVAAVAPAVAQALAQEGRLAAQVELAEQICSPPQMLQSFEKPKSFCTDLSWWGLERDSLQSCSKDGVR